MPTIFELKEQAVTQTPLLLFECELHSGVTERWSTHQVEVDGHVYQPAILKHNAYEIRSSADEGIDALARISVTLANADSHFSEIEQAVGFKGSKLQVKWGQRYSSRYLSLPFRSCRFSHWKRKKDGCSSRWLLQKLLRWPQRHFYR